MVGYKLQFLFRYVTNYNCAVYKMAEHVDDTQPKHIQSLCQKNQVNLSHYGEERRGQCPESPTTFVGSSDLSGHSFARTR